MSPTPVPRSRKFRRRWLIGGIIVIVLGIITALTINSVSNAAPVLPDTTAASRGAIVASVSGSGAVAAAQSLSLPFQTSGTVVEVLAKEGQSVEVGQVLARIDDRTLQSNVASAEANLQSARAELAQSQQGTATESDLVASQASIANAEAQLQQSITGNVKAGDIAQAEAQLRSAQAKLDDLLAGPKPAELSTAQRSLDEAQVEIERLRVSLQETRDSLSKAKTDAESKVRQASIDLQTAQSEYSTVYWEYQSVQGNGRQPAENQGQVNPELSDYGNLSQQEAYRQAELKLHSAEETLKQAQLTYENAVQAEKTGIQQAEQQIASAEAQQRDAEVQLRVTQEGATQAEITEAQASVDEARASLQKLQEGGTPEEIAAAQANVQKARADYTSLTESAPATELEIRQASVASAEQELTRAKLDLEQATLRAPFAGIITAVEIVPGSIVSTSSTAITLVDRSTLHVDMTLSENDVAQVALNMPVLLTIDALTDWQAEGTVSYIAPVGEESNGVVTYQVRVSFPDDEPQVKVGMTANLKITTAEKQDALLVPNSSLLPRGSGRAVQVLNTDGTTTEMPVKTGLTDGVQTEVLEGLSEGALVVTTPNVSEDSGGGGPFGG